MDLESELERLPLHSAAETVEISPSALTLPDITTDITTGSDIVTLSASDINGSSLPLDNSDSEDSDSDADEKKDDGKEGKTYLFLGKRQRTQPVKFETEFSPSSKTAPKKGPKMPKTLKTSSKGSTTTSTERKSRRQRKKPAEPITTNTQPKLRGTRCGKCAGCMREDCGKCVYCLDKAKFGGPGKKKQRCILRTCSNFQHKKGCNPAYLKKASGVTAPGQKTLTSYVEKTAALNASTDPESSSSAPKVAAEVTTPFILASTPSTLPSKDTPPSKPILASTSAPVISTPTTQAPKPGEPSSQASPIDHLAKAKKTLSSSQTSYAKVAMHLAQTRAIIENASKSFIKPTSSPVVSTPTTTKPVSTTPSTDSLLVPSSASPSKPPAAAKGVSAQVIPAAKAVNPTSLSSAKKTAQSPVLTTPISVSKMIVGPATPFSSSVTVTPSGPLSSGSLSSGSLSQGANITLANLIAAAPSNSQPSLKSLKGSASAPAITTSQKSSSKAPASKGVPKAQSSILKAQPVKSPVPSPGNMICIQCGRERSAAMARSSKFCTQRCIINWMEANPDKTPKDAVGDDSIAATISAKLSTTPAAKTRTSPKALPRALKNLQIDMAKPGTKLNLSSSSGEGSPDAKNSKPEPTVPSVQEVLSGDLSMRASIIESLANIISHQQKALANTLNAAGMSEPPKTEPDRALGQAQAVLTPKAQEDKKSGRTPKAEADKTSSGHTPKAETSGHTPKADKPPKAQVDKAHKSKGTKRSATTTQTPSSTKKQKMSTKAASQSSQGKSVSFNLNPSEASEAIPSSSAIPISLEKIASYLQQPKKQTIEIKIPSGLPMDIRQWSVANVVEYFKSTSDCKNYVDLFEGQEVDGIALLLLTHETLVKCLGIKLGRAVKIMSRVQELKTYHDQYINK